VFMSAEKVALLDKIHPDADDRFIAAGFDVERFDGSIEAEELAELAGRVAVLGVRSNPEISAEIIENADTLRAIGCFCVGTDHVDLEAASERGVAVFNSVHENTRSVAELTIAFTTSLLRRIPEHNLSMHAGTWSKSSNGAYETRGKTLGIIGHGNVGSQVAVLAKDDMRVVYFDPNPHTPPFGMTERLESMEEVLQTADIITLHVPGDGNDHLIDPAALEMMKPGSYLINTSRGNVVDYNAVAEALRSGHLAGVAADVFENEPANPGDEFEHVLRGLGNVILTPHIGGATHEAQQSIGVNSANRLARFMRLGETVGSVNFPEMPMGELAIGTQRIISVHQNTAGVMADLTGAIADGRLNVVDSSLKTRDDLGVARFDVEGEVPQDVIDEIEGQEHSIRTNLIS
jgi:D-3-phosphoglycerate dehydrogenase